jgi:UDP-N-acetyl-D-glucosamine dehydrogenase
MISHNANPCENAVRLVRNIEERNFTIGIVGLGYVGLPLGLAAVRSGFNVIGFDVDPRRVELLNSGESGIAHISAASIREALGKNKFRATSEFSDLVIPDAVLIAVPTPLNKQREPDLTFVEQSTRQIANYLRPGQLIVLESTTWPGTTMEVMKPLLEARGLRCGRDFFLAFSPEREDPGNAEHNTATIPKIVGADDASSRHLAMALYQALVVKAVPVSSAGTAEAVKLTENIFRSVNIALVNELKMIFNKMGIDVWEVIEAAKTKPFGFMPFYPGPGLGGHCIPIDPFYLTWKAREFDVATRFIELAGQINTAMPHYVIERVVEEYDRKTGRGLNGSRVLLIGLSYKKNIDDTRESPAFKLIELLERRGATVDYYDPLVQVIPMTREHPELSGRVSQKFTPDIIASYDFAVVATDHDAVDWRILVENAKLIFDTRNVCERVGLTSPNIVKA